MDESRILGIAELKSTTVELAVPEDAEAISELLRRTWWTTYPSKDAGITEEDIRLRTDGANGERIAENIEKWRKQIEASNESGVVFAARCGGTVVGMAAPSIIDGVRHVGAIYVLPEYQGHSIGKKLMEKVLEWHGSDDDIYLSVASYNTNAINFYKRFRFEVTDKTIIDEGNVYGNTLIPEIEMVRRAV